MGNDGSAVTLCRESVYVCVRVRTNVNETECACLDDDGSAVEWTQMD